MKIINLLLIISLSFCLCIDKAFAGVIVIPDNIDITICEQGCDYDNIADAKEYIDNNLGGTNITITFKDNRTYTITDSLSYGFNTHLYNNLTIQGLADNRPTINIPKVQLIQYTSRDLSINIKNINLNLQYGMNLVARNINLENVDLTIEGENNKSSQTSLGILGDVVSLNNTNIKINSKSSLAFIANSQDFISVSTTNESNKYGINLNSINNITDENILSIRSITFDEYFTKHIININNSSFNYKNSQEPFIIYGNSNINNSSFVSNTFGVVIYDTYKNNIDNCRISNSTHEFVESDDYHNIFEDNKYSFGLYVLHLATDESTYYQTTISNSDLSNNDFSVLGYVKGNENYISKYDYDIIINNTKLNRVVSASYSSQSAVKSNLEGYDSFTSLKPAKGLTMHVTNNSEFINKIYLYTEGETLKSNTILDDVNAYETAKSSITIDLEKNIEVNAGETKSVSLNNLFNTYDIEDINDDDWVKVNDSVVDVENGGIIILSAGTNTIEASYNGINYKVNVIVNEEVVNPKTGIKRVSIILVIIASSLFIIYKLIIKKSKFKSI